MKQKLLYICLMILCTLAWSSEVWAIDGYTKVYDVGTETEPSSKTMKHDDGWGDVNNNKKSSYKVSDYVTFSLYASNLYKAAGGFRGGTFWTYQTIDGTLSWTIKNNYYINISELVMTVQSTASGYVDFFINGAKGHIDHIDKDYTATSSGLSLGNNGSVSVKTGAGTHYIKNIKATYQIYHYELDLTELKNKIDAALEKYNGISDKNSKWWDDTLKTVRDNANVLYASNDCKFPNSTYWGGAEVGVKTSTIAAKVMQLQKAMAICDFEEKKKTASEKGYSNTNIRTTTYNSIHTYLNTTYRTAGPGTADLATIESATTALENLITDADDERIAISNFNTAKNNAASYSTDVVPDKVYNTLLHAYDSHNPLTASVEDTNNATSALNSAIQLAEDLTGPYQIALGYYTTAYNTNNSDIHGGNDTVAGELETAKSALENSTDTGGIEAAQAAFISIKEKLDAITTFKTSKATAGNYEQTKIPDAVYEWLHDYDDTKFKPYEKTTTEITAATTDLNSAITAAAATTSAYQTALGYYTTAYNTNNSDVHGSNETVAGELEVAKSALESSKTVDEITAAQNTFISIKEKLDAITTFKTSKATAGNYEQTKIPDAVYEWLHDYDDTKFKPYEKTTTEITAATTDLNSAITAAAATTSAYQTALGYYTTAYNTNNSDVHGSNETVAGELEVAKSALESSKTVDEITAAQNTFIAIKEKLDAITAFKTSKATAATYVQTEIPDAVYTLLHQYDDYDPYGDDAATVTGKKNTLNGAISAADATKSGYQTALGYYNTAVSKNNSNIPSGLETTGINNAKDALEACTLATEVTAVQTTILAIIAKFDEISFDMNIPAVIPWEESVSKTWATATSGKDVSYTSSNPAVVSVSATGATFTRVAAGEVTITASTARTEEKYENQTTRIFKVVPRYYFSVTAEVGSVAGGSVETATVSDSYKDGTPGRTTTENLTTTASFKATAFDDYTFMGWSYTADGDVIPGSNVSDYTPTITNSGVPGSEESLELYAIFKLSRIHLYSNTKPSYEAGEYDEVQLHRSFNKGYSTIALPFQTTLYALTGQRSADDWVAQLSVVTYTAADNGYTLYFKKTGNGADADGGIIEANRPYVLHLSKAVENPVWTNLQVKSPSSSSVVQADKGYADNGYGDYSDWRMHANYEPGESMVGKYGIVNNSHLAGDPDPEHPDESEKTRFPEGCLKLGGTGSTLNAFMAYIEGPTSAPVKAAYLDDDDNADGLLEALRGEEVSGTESVYDLQGRKLPKAQRGLNIIRGADGSVKKVMNK